MYAEEMEAGRWVLNGETVKFDTNGRMFDGQHRLLACDLAGVSFKTYVIRGVNDDRAFATVDVGENRTHGDILYIAGFKDQNNVAAAATLLYHYEKGRITMSSIGANKKAIPKEVLLTYAKPMQPLLEAAAAWSRAQAVSKFVAPSMVTALLLLFSRKNREAAERFFVDLGEGESLTKNDPVYWLRERLISNQNSTEKLTRPALMALIIATWNKRRAGEIVKKLVIPSIFPKVK
jgi:hypothetical protein